MPLLAKFYETEKLRLGLRAEMEGTSLWKRGSVCGWMQNGGTLGLSSLGKDKHVLQVEGRMPVAGGQGGRLAMMPDFP